MSYEYQTGQPSTADSTAQTAKDQAAGVAQSAAASGQHLAAEAKTQAAEIGREAGRQAKGILDQGRAQVGETVIDQQNKLTGGLRTFSQELSSMASGESPSEPGLASDVARQIAQRVDSAASWLDQRDPGELLEEVKTFARSRPGTFLGIAAVAGLLAGRVTRGIKDAASDDSAPAGAVGGYTGDATYGTGPVYGGTTSTGTGAQYATATGGSLAEGSLTTATTEGTAGGYPLAGVEQGYGTSTYATEGSTEDTLAYPSSASYTSGDALGYGETVESTDAPAHRADDLSWPPVHGEGEQR